jgi:hypothetical protein
MRTKHLAADMGLFQELELSILSVDKCPEDFFRGVKQLFGDPSFLALNDSWRFPRFLANNWAQLTDVQREELRPALTASFDRFQDWMGAFVIAEILGEQYSDERALEGLIKLAQTSTLPARALVAHGLKALAAAYSQEPLRDRAIAGLKALASSNTEEVRKEASEALSRLGVTE